MNLLIYLLKTICLSGLLFIYFRIFLRNRRFHGFNRLFLICIPMFSLVLPVLHLNLPGFWTGSSAESPIHLLGVAQGGFEEAVTIYARKNAGRVASPEGIAIFLTIIISVIFFIRFSKNLNYLQNLRRNKTSLRLPDATLYFVREKGTPFSFLKSIFWGEEMNLDSCEGRQILRHELFHVRNNHSLDILGMEILSIVFWFNPFFYLISGELKLIHEYAADEYAVGETNEYEYAGLLLTKISGRPLILTNPFFKNQIKKRIAMITNPNKNKKSMMNRFMILPFIALVLCIFSFKIKTVLPFHAVKNIKVVIDAGHGGVFSGSQINGIDEKDINLIISKKIQSLAAEYNVDVIMSRETDITPGSNNLRESLEYIAALPKNKNADLFISIHTNQTDGKQNGEMQTIRSGFQIWIPRNTSGVYDASMKLGSVLTETIKPDFYIEPELKQTRDDGTNILILKKATVPAVLIECGYMDNPADMKYLQDEKNQEKIARDILEGIKKYSLANSVPSSATTPIQKADNENSEKNILPSNNESMESHTASVPDAVENLWDSAGPLKKVEVEAEYPGDAKGWQSYLFKSLKYPDAAISNEVQGEVIVEFVVNTDGSIGDVHAVSGPKELRAESVRAVMESGHWIPAKNKGMIVAAYKKQPINFKLEVK